MLEFFMGLFFCLVAAVVAILSAFRAIEIREHPETGEYRTVSDNPLVWWIATVIAAVLSVGALTIAVL